MDAVAPLLLAADRSAAPTCRELAEAPDDAVVAEALTGSGGALQLLADRYRSRIYGFALASLRNPDDAEDVAQETLVRAFHALSTYRGRGQFRSWLFRIAANLCRDRRRRGFCREVPLQSADGEVGGGASLQEGVLVRTTIFAALAQLPPLYREPVALHYMEGLSIAETAAVLGRSGTAVRMQLWRARGMLATALEGWEEEPGEREAPRPERDRRAEEGR